MATFKQRVRQLTRRSGGRSLGGGGEAAASLCAGVESLLPVGADAQGLEQTGPVVAPSDARDPAQAMEAWPDDLSGTHGVEEPPRMSRH